MPALIKSAHAEDSAEVEVLLANTEKLKSLTKKIQGSIDRLDTSGKQIQAAIKPIYGNTSKLQVTSNNIDRINHAIVKLRQPLDKTKKEDPIIRAGLQGTPLPEFLASLDRTSQTLANLQQTNMRSNQQAMDDLNDLMRTGNQALEAEFRETLQREASPVEPLQFITKGLPFPKISPDASSRLRLIYSYMAHGGQQMKASNMYTETRSPYLILSLQNLAAASIQAVKKNDHSTTYRAGTSRIGTYSKAIEALFIAEHECVASVFPRDHVTQMHTQTCQGALDAFSGTMQELHGHIRNNIVTDCFLAYEILDVVSALSTSLERGNQNLKQPLAEAMRPIRETAKYSLQRLLEETKTRVGNLMTLPADGSPVHITTDTVMRLQAMANHLPTISAILASFGENGWRPAPHTPSSPVPSSSTSIPTLKDFDGASTSSGSPLFTSYALDTIDTLVSSLDLKSRALLRTKSAQGIFLANNVAVVERLISSFELAPLIADAARGKLEAWRKKGTALALDGWRDPLVHLRDVQYTNRGSLPGQRALSSANTNAAVDSALLVKALSSKDKDATKEKFRAFNASFDECVAKHRSFHMEKEVKPILAREVQSMVEPLYARFWDRYHEIDKGKGRVKYDKAQLGAVLAGLA